MKRSWGFFITALLLCLPASAQAAVLTYTDLVPTASTNWTDSLSVNQFNSSLGTLTKVVVGLQGTVSGTGKYESLDAASSTVNINLQAQIDLKKPDNSLLIQVLPLASITESATAYDGVTDFGGTSGATHTGLSNTASSTITLTAVGDMAPFIGLGTISLPVSALGLSNASGPGNIITQFLTSASAGLTVEYHYDAAAVPEPTSFVLFGGGLFVVLAAGRRKGGLLLTRV